MTLQKRYFQNVKNRVLYEIQMKKLDGGSNGVIKLNQKVLFFMFIEFKIQFLKQSVLFPRPILGQNELFPNCIKNMYFLRITNRYMVFNNLVKRTNFIFFFTEQTILYNF